MNTRNIRRLTLALFTMLGIAVHFGIGQALETDGAFSPAIPTTWDDQEMASLELPLADPAGSPVHVSADYYYRIPVRPIYKSYPVYAPGKEPAGYEEWLKQQEPETVFDASKLKTEADWIKAGAVVFDAPIFYDVLVRAADVKDPLWHEKTGALAAKDGTLPYFRYVVREKGKIELGTISCAMCHTRVMPDGTVIKGAQGNFPFELAGARDFRTLPDALTWSRYSDEQLYALSLYIYSLKPPANPNKFDELARRGQQVFRREGCAVCHTPPLYTNNKLTPVDGFNVPADHLKKYDILPFSVGTDPALALKTRRGTGYYKVPSLKGVWYRSPFEHNGSVAKLEDWFDPRRLRDDYAPTGFRGAGVKTRAIKGHAYGLNLSAPDRRALIAFLKTL
jgi:hypothetical protein